METEEKVKLTQYSHGAGCGCKISPQLLSEILKTDVDQTLDHRLLVGNVSSDDAAVYDMGNGNAIISTTDFFMPIVDDPFTFGKIAAANAISDVYAMGGNPLLAIAILGWPINKLGPEIARDVLNGGRAICEEAGIQLAGGHSIDCPEPIFGLAVTGNVAIEHLKRNNTAIPGCNLYLTKSLGVGILSTAQKKGVLREEDAEFAPDSMMTLNKIGLELAKIKGVTAMTDVTGFGLLGHLKEMCVGSNVSATVYFEKVPKLAVLDHYIELNCVPGGTTRNWDSYGDNIMLESNAYKTVLCDPQTSGGLLIAVLPENCEEVEQLCRKNDIEAISFGELDSPSQIIIKVK